MERQIQVNSSNGQIRGYRRVLLVFLAFVYLFVGILHQVSCFDQAVASSFAVAEVSNAPHDAGTSSELAVCDHCPNCVPAVMPAPAVEATPCGLSSSIVTAAVSFLAADHARLDFPPPKSLT